MKEVLDFLASGGVNNAITIMISIFGAIGWVIVFISKGKQNKRQDRLTVYKESLDKIDRINAQITSWYSKDFILVQQGFYKNIFADPQNSMKYVSEFTTAAYGEMARMVETLNISFSEFNKLRLVASRETLLILDKYKDLSMKQMNSFSDVLEGFRRGNITGGNLVNSNMQVTPSAIELGNEIKEIQKQLEDQMRKDIGFY